MLCQICKKAEATVHLTQVVGGKIRKLDLCAACAEKCGVDDPAGFSMLEILKKFSHAINSDKEEDPKPKKKQTEELVCPECGYTSQDLSKTGKLGCPFCYKTFVENLENALKHMHRGTQHIGKTPKYHPLPESGTAQPAAEELPVKKTRKRAAAKTASSSSKKKAGAPDVYENQELLEELYESKKALLKQTIEEENYEYAAKIRDEIKELEKKIESKKEKNDETQDLLGALKTLFDSVEGEDK